MTETDDMKKMMKKIEELTKEMADLKLQSSNASTERKYPQEESSVRTILDPRPWPCTKTETTTTPRVSSPRSTKEFEKVILTMEQLLNRMTPSATSDSEKLFITIEILHSATWKGIRRSPQHRTCLTKYANAKVEIKKFTMETQLNQAMDYPKSEEQLLALPNGNGKYRGRPDQSIGSGMRAKISCHFCGKVGHYAQQCWVKDPTKKPKKFQEKKEVVQIDPEQIDVDEEERTREEKKRRRDQMAFLNEAHK